VSASQDRKGFAASDTDKQLVQGGGRLNSPNGSPRNPRSKSSSWRYRGHAPYVTFLFARAVAPIVMFVGSVL